MFSAPFSALRTSLATSSGLPAAFPESIVSSCCMSLFVFFRIGDVVLERLSHTDHHFAFPGEGLSAVGGKHVVEHQDVALLPGKTDCLLFIDSGYLVQHRRLDRRPVTVIDI